MRLSITQSDAAAAFSRIHGIVDRKSTIPILSHVAITANGALTLRATDLDCQAVIHVDCDITETGEITAPLATISDAVRASAGDVGLELDGTRLLVRAGAGKLRIPTLPMADFPFIPEEGLIERGEIDAAELLKMIATVGESASRDAGKFNVNGINLSSHERRLRMVATDGRRLALCDPMAPFSEGPAVTVPNSTLAVLGRFLRGAEAVRIATSGNLIRFETDGGSLLSKIITLPFAPYEKIVPSPLPEGATVEVAPLANALRRVLIMAQSEDRIARMRLVDGAITLTSHHMTAGDAEDECPAIYGGPEVTRGIQAQHVLDALLSSGAETVELSASPNFIVIRPAEATSPLFLVGSMKAKDAA